MDLSSWLPSWNEIGSGYLVLLACGLVSLTTALLYWVGFLPWVLGLFQGVVGSLVYAGFQLWKRLFSWADWRLLLLVAIVLITLGKITGETAPALQIVFGALLLFLGVITCLACVQIDLDRYEVARGYKALHKPLKGQGLALNLVQYGQRVDVFLLSAATLGMIGGFALLNQGLYETVGRNWYTLTQGRQEPIFADFLVNTLIHLLRVVDLLDLANSYNKDHFLIAYIRQTKWPASTLLALFKTFFSLVLLQQIFTAVRQRKLLAETVTDFWSPHPPIHERAAGSLPQHGPAAVWSLLQSLRTIEHMTAEQRDHLPRIIADIGPGAIPILVHHLEDPDANVRAVAAGALGHLHALDTIAALTRLSHDPEPEVRQSLVQALGTISGSKTQTARRRRTLRTAVDTSRQWLWKYLPGRWGRADAPSVDPMVEAVATLQAALTDPVLAVREQAVQSLGRIGAPAKAAAPHLIAVLKETEETLRCQVAEALGLIGGATAEIVPALVELLEEPIPALRTAAAHALGALKADAAAAVPALLPLLQERDETVRQAVAEAIGQIGVMHEETVPILTEGLTSSDALVQAQTAEVLGTIGEAAAEATPALAAMLVNGGDRVRAKAAEALGKIGEGAAEAIPQLVDALHGKDSWVSALAAEALGAIGETSGGAVPALVRSLRHTNPQVRANAAEALGRLGDAAQTALPALERATADEDNEVRSHALFALGEVGPLTEAGGQRLLAALDEDDPQVRIAAVEALGKRPQLKAAASIALVRLLEDANDQVQIAAVKVLPKLAHAEPAVIDGLCRLLQDDDLGVQTQAALALGQFGAAAQAAGAALQHAAQTGEAELREQALRALVHSEPPEAVPAFLAGLKDAQPEVRKVASAGLLTTAQLPPEAVPGLIEALRDPEIQVRANAVGALARFDPLPPDAVPYLIEYAAATDEGLRLNAALALRAAPPSAAAETFHHLLSDSNPRLRLIAAGFLLEADPDDALAVNVLDHALADPTSRLRLAALKLIEALGPRGVSFHDLLRARAAVERDPEVSDLLDQLVTQLERHRAEEPQQTETPRQL